MASPSSSPPSPPAPPLSSTAPTPTSHTPSASRTSPPSTAPSTSSPPSTTPSTSSPLFPPLTRTSVLAFQFSSWYPLFASNSIKSTIIRPVGRDFGEYLDEDGVMVPRGAEDLPAESTLSDDESDGEEEDGGDDVAKKQYAFPELDARIRACVREYGGGVFPKLNFSSPQDASWLLPPSSPLKCTSPADVYLLLKSSDFVTHDLSVARVFEGCEDFGESDDVDDKEKYELELVLRKWYPIDRAREVRCFVRDGVFIGISQRDPNFYPFWTDPSTQLTVRRALYEFWSDIVRDRWSGGSYTFDLILTRSLTNAHIIDFNPYHPKTDSLLFDYDELYAIYVERWGGGGTSQVAESSMVDSTSTHTNSNSNASTTLPEQQNGHRHTDTDDTNALPVLRVIPSASHPSATRNAPRNQHNMVPYDALEISSGADIEAFAERWGESVGRGVRGEDADEG